MSSVSVTSSEFPAIPKHVAIVMDGNGRWAQKKGVSIISGHRAGAEAARKITEKAANMGIPYLTLYTFSSENWSRPAIWIEELMGLLRWYLQNEVKSLQEAKVKLQVIGDRERLPADILKLIEDVERETFHNDRITLMLALSYGGRDELVRAARKIAQKSKSGEINPEEITQEIFSEHLYTAGIPDPDLLIRTSGEQRISNFLLWQLAYAEFVFVDTLWPDFSPDIFSDAITQFQKRDRRYGAIIAS